MKIIVATALYPPEIESLATYSQDVVRYLQKNHQVSILAYANQVEKSEGLNILALSKRQPLWLRLFNYTRKLFSLAKKADLIYVQNSVAVGLPVIIVKLFSKTPVVINFAEDEAWKRASSLHLTSKSYNSFLRSHRSNKRTRLIMKLQGWILRQASAVIAPSETLVKIISDVYGLSEQRVFVNYIAEDKKIRLPFLASKTKQQIFTIGTLVDWSGIADIIEAFATVQKDFPESKLVISGDGPAKDKFQRIAHDLGIVEKVKFLGKVSQAQNYYLRQSSALYVYNLKANDFSHGISQGWLAGLPVVAAATDVAQEIVADYGGALLFEVDNKDDLAKKIGQIFSDNELSNKLTAQAKENLDKRFSWSAHIKKLNSIFELLLK